MQRTPELAIIEQAALAAERKLGLRVRVLKQARTVGPGVTQPDALVEIAADGHTHRFVAEAKATDRVETLAYANAQLRRMIAQGFPGYRPLLLAPYLTRTLADQCRRLKLPFLDMAGNAYLEAPGLLIYATGEPRADALRTPTHRAATAAGARVVFALLCWPELTQANYRELALAAGVALGTVGGVLADLHARGFLPKGKRPPRLRNTPQLVAEWIANYAATLRPKLHPRRFQCEPARLLAADFTELHAWWGGEVAGQKLTGYLKPERFLIYLTGPLNPLLARGRMRVADNGNTEILDAFWPEAPIAATDLKRRTVPPLLAYADLMITGEGRNVETAKLIYDQFLAPALGA